MTAFNFYTLPKQSLREQILPPAVCLSAFAGGSRGKILRFALAETFPKKLELCFIQATFE